MARAREVQRQLPLFPVDDVGPPDEPGGPGHSDGDVGWDAVVPGLARLFVRAYLQARAEGEPDSNE